MSLLGFLKTLRPRQWTKNLLIFAGILFAQRWDDPQLAFNVVMAFVVFCALSGVVYVFNDILDAEKDRQHPRKKNRPIASGQLSPATAGTGAFLLFAGSMVGSWFITPWFLLTAVIYIALTTAYSLWLKHVVILDIMVLAVGFVVRAMAGIEAMHLPGGEPVKVTPFFILTTLFLALFLAVGKRRNELVNMQAQGGVTRKVLKEYGQEYLDVLLTLATTGVLGSYAAWATLGKMAKINETYTMVFTMPFVLYGIFRYLWLVLRKDEGEAPEVLLLTDKPLLITVLLWLVTVVIILSI